MDLEFSCYECGKALAAAQTFLVPMAIQNVIVSNRSVHFKDAIGHWSRSAYYCKHCIMRAIGASPNDFPLPKSWDREDD